jgi:hypothetical protein
MMQRLQLPFKLTKLRSTSAEELQKLLKVGKETADKINHFWLTIGNVTPETMYLIQYVKITDFPID